MNDMIKVSVVIPCYNCAQYLPKCFEALRNQTYKNFDVICVDDCSKDTTVDVINGYITNEVLSIKLLRNETNRGPAYSRKRAILESTADFICFCDSDDWYDDNFLSLLVKSQKDNDSDLVACGIKRVLDNGIIIRHPMLIDDENLENKKEWLVSNLKSLCKLMIRRSIVSEIAFPNIRNGEDMAIIPLMIIKAKRFSCVPDCIYNYYCRSNSASKNTSKAVLNSLLDSFNHIRKNIPEEYNNEIEFIGIRNYVYGALLNNYRGGFNRSEGRSIVKIFTIMYPQWGKNKYVKRLNLFKRNLVFFAKYNIHFPIYIMAQIHKIFYSISSK